MSSLRKLIVTGATGKQGGGLIAALLSKQNQPFEIYAVTRNPESRSSQALSSKGVKIIKGDFDHINDVFAQVKNPWGLFMVTPLDKGHKVEETYGKAMSKAAFDAGIKHIVFTATERGGQEKSDNDPTIIPHFASKYNIERDIVERAKSSKQGTTWTFLRPVAFYENLTPNYLGKGFTSIWRLNGMDNKVQFISTKDIGKIAAEAFLHSSSPEYKNAAVSIAGDELTPAEMARTFKEVTGENIPNFNPVVGRLLRWMLWNDLGIMFQWFSDEGFDVNMKAVRSRYPFLKDFRQWLETESAWAKK